MDENDRERISGEQPRGGALIREVMEDVTRAGSSDNYGSGPLPFGLDLSWLDSGSTAYCRIALTMSNAIPKPTFILHWDNGVWCRETRGNQTHWPWMATIDLARHDDGMLTHAAAREILLAMRDYYEYCLPLFAKILVGEPVPRASKKMDSDLADPPNPSDEAEHPLLPGILGTPREPTEQASYHAVLHR